MTYKITHKVYKGHRQLLKPTVPDVTHIEVFKARTKKKWFGKKTEIVYDRIAKYSINKTIESEDRFKDSLDDVESYLKSLDIVKENEVDYSYHYGEDWDGY